MRRRAGEDGVILLNVLFVCALAAAVVLLMIGSQGVSLDRSIRLEEAAQAAAWARAGETSAVVALRRDAREAPEADGYQEAWSAVEDADVAIDGGRFSLTVEDDRARLDVNTLVDGGPGARGRIERIVALARLPASTTDQLERALVAGRVDDLGDLVDRGMSPAAIDALAPWLTALPPGRSGVNVNTADPRLLAILMGNPAQAERIVALRRARALTAADLRQAGIVLPPGLDTRSDNFTVRTTVDVGGTRQVVVSRLVRRGGGDRTEVEVWRRTRGGGVTPAA